jgi:hypothetical protein
MPDGGMPDGTEKTALSPQDSTEVETDSIKTRAIAGRDRHKVRRGESSADFSL